MFAMNRCHPSAVLSRSSDSWHKFMGAEGADIHGYGVLTTDVRITARTLDTSRLPPSYLSLHPLSPF
jgi:hypothetical protein